MQHGLLAILGIAIVACESASGAPAFDRGERVNEADAGPLGQVIGADLGYIWWYDDDDLPQYSDYEIRDGSVIVEGDLDIGNPVDIMASDAEIRQRIADDDKSIWDTRSRRHWENGIVRYEIGSNFSPAERAAIQTAVANWNSNSGLTGVSWVERAPANGRREERQNRRHPGVKFARYTSGGCNAKIGRHQRQREIHLAVPRRGNSCMGVNVIMHEMGHMVGIRHEQQRTDRGEWIDLLDRNYTGKRGDIATRGGINRRLDSVGGYDEFSLMQYFTTAFSRNRIYHSDSASVLGRTPLGPNLVLAPAPVFQSRRRTSLWTQNTLGLYGRGLWGERTVFGDRGIDLDDVRVVDVDNDGRDDLLASHDGRVWWSSQGRSGWLPLDAGSSGQVEADLFDVEIGDFDGDGSYDVIVVENRTWTIRLGTGVVERVERAGAVRAFAVGDLDANGFSDVFVINQDGSWSAFLGPDLLGSESSLRPDDMRVRDVRLVRLGGTSTTLDVVAFVDSRLQRSIAGTSDWTPVFPRASDPLPEHVNSLDELWFGNFDAPAGPAEFVDILASSQGNDLSGVGRGVPVFVPDALAAASSSLRGLPAERLDVETEVAVGDFMGSGLTSIISLHSINSQQGFSRGDIAAIATRYGDLQGPMLADRYPMATSLSFALNPLLPYDATLMPQERVELWAWYAAPSSFDVDILISRRQSDGTWSVVSTERRRAKTSENFVKVSHVFQERGGEWRVQFVPISSTGLLERTTWRFNIAGDACGDGFRDPGEQCDSGSANSTQPDACRPTCLAPRCGDGVADSSEFCDDGSANSDSTPNVCRPSCRLPSCGDGVVDNGEVCDAGGSNSDTMGDACRLTCTLPVCGDAVYDPAFGEQCDAGSSNSTAANQCRPGCAIPMCGDGIVDTEYGDRCDDQNADDADGCRANCSLTSCGNGVLDAASESCDGTPGCYINCHRCGDGSRDAQFGEQCDLGPSNGQTGFTCNTVCASVAVIE